MNQGWFWARPIGISSCPSGFPRSMSDASSKGQSIDGQLAPSLWTCGREHLIKLRRPRTPGRAACRLADAKADLSG